MRIPKNIDGMSKVNEGYGIVHGILYLLGRFARNYGYSSNKISWCSRTTHGLLWDYLGYLGAAQIAQVSCMSRG